MSETSDANRVLCCRNLRLFSRILYAQLTYNEQNKNWRKPLDYQINCINLKVLQCSFKTLCQMTFKRPPPTSYTCLYLAVSALGLIIHSEEAGLTTVSKTPENVCNSLSADRNYTLWQRQASSTPRIASQNLLMHVINHRSRLQLC